MPGKLILFNVTMREQYHLNNKIAYKSVMYNTIQESDLDLVQIMIVYLPVDRMVLRKVKFAPILSRSGKNLTISSISGKALASFSRSKRNESKLKLSYVYRSGLLHQ